MASPRSLSPHRPPAEPRTARDLTSSLSPPPLTRLLLILSFPLFFLLALPFWYYTTSITRLPLPVARIERLSNRTYPAAKHLILFTADDGAFPEPPAGRAKFEKNEVLTFVGTEVMKKVDGMLGQLRPWDRGVRGWELEVRGEKDKRPKPPLRVHVRRTDKANTSWPLRPYIQPKESGLVRTGLAEGSLVIPVHPGHISDRIYNHHLRNTLIRSLYDILPIHPSPPEIPRRALKYQPNITLSFVLLNEDSTVGAYVREWDVQAAIKEHILPHLEPLSPVFNFTIESQVLYHAPLFFEPTPHAPMDAETSKGGWVIGEEEMKIFVNSERWSLDSGSSNNPVLRFLLFVPSAKHRPLHLSTPDSANAFLIPQFGSVHILNPPSLSSASSADQPYTLTLPSLAPSFHLFTTHLYSLLSLPLLPSSLYPPPASPLDPPKPSIQPLSYWQVLQVMEQRTRENSDEARQTLMGIGRLVKKIKEMKVDERVKGMVEWSVAMLEALDRTRDPVKQFTLSRDAVNLANQAFFDPGMMGLLYFPDEHKFAVYTPLFAPIAVPLLVGVLKEFLAWRKRRRAAIAPSTAVDVTRTVKDKEEEAQAEADDDEIESRAPATAGRSSSGEQGEVEPEDVAEERQAGHMSLRKRRSRTKIM